MSVQRFGSVDGQDVWEASLRNGAGAEARIITWGAVIRDLVVPAGDGRQRVVLGFDTLEAYLAHSPYFGAVVGRYANRIGGARFSLDGRTYRLDANQNGRHQLHGGSSGFGTRVWTLVDHAPEQAVLALVSRDGDMGYPGQVVATCTYRLLEPATLRISLRASTDRPSPVNLTTHSYLNLDGSPDIGSHRLTIAGDFVTPTDGDLIPTGAVEPVGDGPYDFRSLRPVAASPGPQGRTLYDINYVLRSGGGALAHAATVQSPSSGVSLELWTTEPGLQFYDGHLIDIPVAGLGGARYGTHAGLCLEPQRFPDGPNKPHFPPCIVRPGELSRQESELRFSVA
jgi:aldose 1-epimerase